jgi:tetratricopeptide (TPR) repeat protein/bacterioferritin-associated ferredoxin
VLKSPFAEAIDVSDDVIQLAGSTTVDTLETMRLDAAGDLEGALAMSTAAFMPWLDERDPAQGGWLAAERQRWSQTYVELLRRAAADAEEHGDLPLARRHVAAWVRIHHHSEAAHRLGIRLAVIAADASAARRLASDCEAMTTATYGRGPSAATRAWIAALDPPRPGRSVTPTWPITGRAALLNDLIRSRPTILTTAPGLGGSQVLAELARGREHHLLVQGRAAVGPLVCLGVALRDARIRGRHAQHALAALASGDTGERARAVFVAAVLEAIGTNGALLLDDMHLFDQASLDVVAGVLRTIERASQGQQPIIVGTMVRQEMDLQPLAGWLRLAQGTHRMRIVPLEPLTRSDVAAILTHVLAQPPSDEALSALWQVTGGWPGFIDLTLRHWAASGVLLPDDAGWSLEVERARSLPLPPAGVELVVSRVDALGRERRRVLEVCLCLDEASPGEEPTSEDIMAVTGQSRWDVVEILEHLDRSGFTRNGVPIIGPYSRSIMAMVPRETQRAIHRSIAERLLVNGGPTDRVARHLALAGDTSHAARQWLHHAVTCRRRLRWDEALTTSAQALDLGLPLDDEIACRLDRFDILMALGDPQRARAELAATRGLVTRPDDRASLRVREARMHLIDGAYEAALTTVDGLLTGQSDGSHVPEAHLLRGLVLARMGRLDEARTALSSAQNHPAHDDTLRDQECARAMLEVDMAAARFEDARQHIPTLARLTSLVGFPYVTALTEGTLARFHAMQAEHEPALDHAARWLSIAREQGFRGMEAQALVLHASIRLEQGNYAESLASYVNALPDITPDQRAVVQANIGTCYLQLGQVATALAHYEAAITDAELRHEPLKVVRRRLALHEARLRHGDATDRAELAGIRDQDEALGGTYRTWVEDLEAHAAAMNGEVTDTQVAAVAAHPHTLDEVERRDVVLAMCSLARGDVTAALEHAARQPTSARAVAIVEALTGMMSAQPPTGAAVEELVLAHVRNLNGHGPASEVAQRQTALEEAWPEHGGALRRLLDFHTRAVALRPPPTP